MFFVCLHSAIGGDWCLVREKVPENQTVNTLSKNHHFSLSDWFLNYLMRYFGQCVGRRSCKLDGQ